MRTRWQRQCGVEPCGCGDNVSVAPGAGNIITLVPFAGTNLIRFRGSRMNGLSPRAVKTGWALRQDTAPSRGELKHKHSMRDDGVPSMIEHQPDQAVFEGEAHCQGFTHAG